MLDEADNLIEAADGDRRGGRLDAARSKLLEAVGMRRQVGGVRLARALMQLGRVERDLGREQEALALYQESADLCRASDHQRHLAHALRHIGDIHLDADRLTQADACLREALALYRADAEATALEIANAIRPLAILKARTGADDKARRLFEEAKALYETARVSEGAEECASWLNRLPHA